MAELVADCQPFEPPSVFGLIEHKVVAPHFIDPRRPLVLRTVIALPEPLLLALPARHFQSYLPPAPLHPLRVDHHPGSPQQRRRNAIASTRPLSRKAPQLRRQRRIFVPPLPIVSLCAVGLPDRRAGPALARATALLQMQGRCAYALRAHHSPSASSVSIARSSGMSATIRFKRPFSLSSSLSHCRFPLSLPSAPAAIAGRSADWLPTSCRLPSRSGLRPKAVRFTQLYDDIFGCVSFAFHFKKSAALMRRHLSSRLVQLAGSRL